MKGQETGCSNAPQKIGRELISGINERVLPAGLTSRWRATHNSLGYVIVKLNIDHGYVLLWQTLV